MLFGTKDRFKQVHFVVEHEVLERSPVRLPTPRLREIRKLVSSLHSSFQESRVACDRCSYRVLVIARDAALELELVGEIVSSFVLLNQLHTVVPSPATSRSSQPLPALAFLALLALLL